MTRKPIPRPIMLLLIALSAVTPIAVCVVMAVSTLLGAMQDATGARVLTYIAWAFGILWLIDLICLVLAAGLNSLGDRDVPPEA